MRFDEEKMTKNFNIKCKSYALQRTKYIKCNPYALQQTEMCIRHVALSEEHMYFAGQLRNCHSDLLVAENSISTIECNSCISESASYLNILS